MLSPPEIQAGANFTDDLELDSLDVISLLIAVEERYDVIVPDSDARQIHTIEELVQYLLARGV